MQCFWMPVFPRPRVRSKDENPGVQVVMASGFLEAEKKSEMTLAGVKRFVNKPYMMDELLVVFRSLFANE